jgi:hypothetical protein
MKTKYLLSFLGVLAFTAPIWAGPAAPADFLMENSIALASHGPMAQSVPLLAENPAGDFSDTIPIFPAGVSGVGMGLDFLAQESTVGLSSVDGVGMMFTFKL